MEELVIFSKSRACQDGVESRWHLVVVQEGQGNKLVEGFLAVGGIITFEPFANWLMVISHPEQDDLPEVEKVALAEDMGAKLGIKTLLCAGSKSSKTAKV